jgi:hypothetical protein
MATVTRVVDLEITRKSPGLDVADADSALVLFRLHGRPLGWGASAAVDGRLNVRALLRQLVHEQV